MHVAICALTFRRPDGLAALLRGVASLELSASASTELVIVDNDPEGSAEAVVEQHRVELPCAVHYVVESRRGIAQGRNRAAEVALAHGADLVAFIDDDEVPDPAWLTELLRVQAATGADVVTGPVLPVFEEPPPRWVVSGGFFERPRFATGTRITYARTSNVLIAAALLLDPTPPFDEAFGTTGGEDTHFFMRARLAGAHIAWADDALVSELVPSSRLSATWLTKRAYRRGNTLSLCLRDLRDSWPARVKRVGAAGVEIAVGASRLIVAVVGGRRWAVAGMSQVAYGVGLVTGLVGLRYDEYRTIHGR